jgi:hypothetical protein
VTVNLATADSLLVPNDEVGRRLRMVEHGSDAAAAAKVAARIYVAEDGGPLRTIMGDAHRHYTGEEHSAKTKLSNPYEGGTEHALIMDSELRSCVLDYRTQAARLRFQCGGETREWIIDHLRHVRGPDGDHVEAIECKPDVSYLADPEERAKLEAAFRIAAAIGWRPRVMYERGVRGGGERQINFGHIYAHQTATVPDDRLDVFEDMVLRTPVTTFRELREALDPDRNQGTALAHALICRGRVEVDLDRHLFGGSRVRLLPEPAFTSLIRF